MSVDLEASRRDPILRLDQLITRQDEMLLIAKNQLRMMQIVGVLYGCQMLFTLAILFYLIWK
jgi:hypothetical protein